MMEGGAVTLCVWEASEPEAFNPGLWIVISKCFQLDSIDTT